MENKEKIVCFTGHRPIKLPWGYNEEKENCIQFKKDLEKVIRNEINNGAEIFLTGMAEGFDMIAAEIVLKLIKEFPNIKIIAVIPCKNQEKKWNISQQERYWNIVNQCDKRIILSENITKECFNQRNMFMVQNSHSCIACWNGKPSGTGNTIRYAKEYSLKIKVINPEEYKI